MTSVIDVHMFAITAKDLAKKEIEYAEKKALLAHSNDIPPHVAKMLARKICAEIFKDYTEKLKEAYPSESVSSLVSLTADARKIELTVTIVDSIANTIISGESQVKKSEDS